MADNQTNRIITSVQSGNYQTQGEKREAWQQIRRNVAAIIDEEGGPIDQGMIDTVAALNINSFPTTGSCQGHVKTGAEANGPWVDVEPLATTENWQRLNSLPSDSEERKRLEQKLEPIYLEYYTAVMRALSNFYEKRKAPFEQQLTIEHSRPFYFRIKNNGSELQNLRTPEEQGQKLVEYLGEMQAFGEFLKEHYFNS